MTAPTILDLLDPDAWEEIPQEANADLFVAWDALALSRMGAHYAALGRILCASAPGDTWTHSREAERALLQWAASALARMTRVAVERVVCETYLAPVCDALRAASCEGRWRPLRGHLDGYSIVWGEIERSEQGIWESWVEELVQRRMTRPEWTVRDQDTQGAEGREGVVYLLSGINGPHSPQEAPHRLPMLPGTTWRDVVEGIRWIFAMAWFAELQGETFPLGE